MSVGAGGVEGVGVVCVRLTIRVQVSFQHQNVFRYGVLQVLE